MQNHSHHLYVAAAVTVAAVLSSRLAHAQQRGRDEPGRSHEQWYAGTWDSTLYAWSDPIHPRTVAVRVEVLDSRTLLPVAGAIVRLKGAYAEERLGRLADLSTPRIQRREYELRAQTGRDGVVVFALSWQKEYPWSQERPLVRDRNVVGGAKTFARSWIRPVDDAEKVRSLEVRHRRYVGSNIRLGFEHLLDFGHNTSSELQEPELFDRFERAWRNEIRNPAVRFCALRLGKDFSGFGDKRSRQREFFERIRREDFGIVYETPQNLTGLSRSEFAGPYFVYLLQLTVGPARTEIDVIRDRTPDPHADPKRPNRSRSGEHRRSASADEERAKAEAERRGREEKARRAEEGRRKAGQAERAKAEERQRQLRNEASQHSFGVAVKTLTSGRRRQLGLYPGTAGVVIEYVSSGSPAANSGLKKDDVIESIVHRSVSGKKEFRDRTSGIKSGDQVLVGFWHKNRRGKWERESRILQVK